MPRIYTSTNDPYDFCKRCFPSEKKAQEVYGDIGDGPDGRGNCFEYDAFHPEYDYSGYRCCKCKKSLTLKDEYK